MTRLGTGHYNVTLVPDLGGGFAIPVVTSFEGNAGNMVPYVQVVGGDRFEVRFFERTTAAPTLIDSQFTFIVMDSTVGGPAQSTARFSTSSTTDSETPEIAAPY